MTNRLRNHFSLPCPSTALSQSEQRNPILQSTSFTKGLYKTCMLELIPSIAHPIKDLIVCSRCRFSQRLRFTFTSVKKTNKSGPNKDEETENVGHQHEVCC